MATMNRPASRRFRNAIGREAGSPGIEDEAYGRLTDFNVRDAVGETARAGFETFREDLGREIEALRGQNVGMGRIDSGFAWADEGDAVKGGLDRLNRQVAGSAVQAAGIESGNRQAAADMSSRRSGRYYDMLAGDRDFETAEANVEQERKTRRRGGVGGLIGAGVGALAGSVIPGAGTAAGAGLGSKLGGYIGQLFS